MKLAVVGGGSTYTPELIDGFARLARRSADRRAVARRPGSAPARAGRRRSRGACSRARATPGKIVTTSDLVAGVSDADVVLIQLRVGGQAAGKGDETWPHECGCIGQETTGPGGFAKALRTVPVVLRVAEAIRAARQAGRLDHRLHQPGRHRHPRAAAGGPPRRRAVQRRDRLPTPLRRDARRRATSDVQLAARRPQPPHLGARRSPWTARDVLPELLARPPRRARATRSSCRRLLLSLLGDRAVVLPALLLRARRGARRAARRADPGRSGAWRSRRRCSSCTPTRASNTKPEALEKRGGAFYSEAAVDLIASLHGRPRRRAGGQPRATTAPCRSCRTTT